MPESQERLRANLEKINRLLLALTTSDGVHPTPLDDVTLVRATSGTPRSLVLYEPSIYLQVNGTKNGFWGETQFICGPNHYLIFSVAISLEVMTEAGDSGDPVLGVHIRIGLPTLLELVHKLGMQKNNAGRPDVLTPTPLGPEMSEAMLRLLRSLGSAADATILGPGIVRELIYHALIGPAGGTLREMLSRTHQAEKIYTALEWMHLNYQRPFNIPDIANEVGMSVSAFHHSFKEITGRSPLQYMKSVRLQRARLHIKYDRLGAWMAGAKVGYESPSQFSRDFKRHFGYSPAEEYTGEEAAVQVDDFVDPEDGAFTTESKLFIANPKMPGSLVDPKSRDEDDSTYGQ